MSNFGTFFRVTTFGESHCKAVGAIIEGVPPRMRLNEADIQPQLTRRRPGQSDVSTPRNEKDTVTILSGTEHGFTLGTPIGIMVRNKDQRPHDYSDMDDVPRPSHADYTYQMKYGIRASSGGGRSSARETIGRVAAGAIAEKWLSEKYNLKIVAWVSQVSSIKASGAWEEKVKSGELDRKLIDENIIRCPDKIAAEKMIKTITEARDAKDSLGGVITCVCTNVPVGLGEPCFDKLEARLAQAMLSIPATKGFEIGSGFVGATMKGSEHNDPFISLNDDSHKVPLSQIDSWAGAQTSNNTPISSQILGTITNRSGGIQGGISNGQDIVFRVAFKPAATIGQEQFTTSFAGNKTILAAKGRHDPCVVARAVPIVEAMTAIVLADASLIQESRIAVSNQYNFVGRARSVPIPGRL